MASVKVAVRVRPLNQREINMNSLPIIEMDGKKTRICNKGAGAKQEGEAAREKYKDFTFDYSYWSYDDHDSHFATQEQVFKDLGTDVVENVFTGYNYCVFAYGQTGSGKTHTMMGSQTSSEGPGLIPRICQSMFNRMNEGKQTGTTYRVEVSYLEIYNERVKDLLKKTSTNSHSLKVREHPKTGPYVEDLSKHLVMDYSDILSVMNRGNLTRTTASTNMNDVSSRSHAIFTMTFSQAGFVEGMPSETVSKVHLVDLAGSERADASGATGQRLKEGAHINKSLVTLGSVISALAEISESHRNSHSHKPAFIPYRDSTLTWLLKDSLGGNAKTIMIATISPADCNYGETLSTLRYANRAKNIINKPTINEDINVKLIKELRAEINKLKMLLTSNVDDLQMTPEMLAELHQKEAREKSLTEEWTEKWKETQKILMEQKDLALRKTGTGVILDSQKPHLIRIDDDLTSTGITLYHLKEGETKIGAEEGSHIVLPGLDKHHCSITLESGSSTLIPYGSAVCRVNSQIVSIPTKLSQGCAIRLGETTMFRYNDPVEAAKLRREGNLNRNSFMSRSATDLAWSTEFNSSVVEEETNLLEEKKKQLELEEARLQKESQELLQEKAQLELQRSNYKLRQQETEEAWKAEQLNRTSELAKAQAALEQNRHKFELEYAAHKRRLAEDYKRLDQDEQETLATLHLKEADLKKRREYFDWEIEQEMEQMEVESLKIDKLKAVLEQKSQEIDTQMSKFAKHLQEKLDKPDEDFKKVLTMNDFDFKKYIDEQEILVKEWKNSTLDLLNKEKVALANKLKEVTQRSLPCEDPQERQQFEQESKKLEADLNGITTDISKVQDSFQSKTESLSILPQYREIISVQNQECSAINKEIETSIKNLHAHEEKMTKIEGNLSLIADQEKLIVGQLAHIGNSKQKLLTIIENATEGFDLKDVAPGTTFESPTTHVLKNDGVASPAFRSRESSPNQIGRRSDFNPLRTNDLSPIKRPTENIDIDTIETPNSSVAQSINGTLDNITNLNSLIEQITAQKAIVLDCLENDCDKEELNTHLKTLQELRRRYLELDNCADSNLRQRWLLEFDDDSTFELDKTGDGTSFAGSDLDDIQSITTEQDEQLQMLVEEGVERRLREILQQLKSGETPTLLSQYGINNRMLRRSLPCDLNNEGGATDTDGSTESLHNYIPRSHSMNSGSWSTGTSLKNGALPGILDIRIPSFCERGSGAKTHIKFEVVITTAQERWVILRRYNQFRELYKSMSKKYGTKVSKLPFPSRSIFGRLEAIARERRGSLELFLQNLVKVCFTLPTSPLYNTNAIKIKQSLLSFSNFFEKGVFDSTKYGTS